MCQLCALSARRLRGSVFHTTEGSQKPRLVDDVDEYMGSMIYMGSMMIILPFKNSGGYRMWDVFVGQGSEGSEFTTVRCTLVV